MTSSQVGQEATEPDGPPEITFRVTRLTKRLTVIQAKARAGRNRLVAAGWVPFSSDSGLTPAQEVFISGWSPDDVLDLCRALRQMIKPGPDQIAHPP